MWWVMPRSPSGLRPLRTRRSGAEPATPHASSRPRWTASTGIRRRFPLPTRIGLHSGQMVLGHVGAMDHYEYRAVGDIVNTAARIERLNKLFRTRMLASDDLLFGLDDFLTRRLGTFLLAGKSKPLVIHELICRQDEATERAALGGRALRGGRGRL